MANQSSNQLNSTNSSSNSTSGALKAKGESAVASFENDAASGLRGITDRAMDIGGRISGQIGEYLGDVPATSRELAGKVDQNVRNNPWMHIGAIGVGALALGFLLGRVSTSATDAIKKNT